ncbi:uncharacterized protein BDV17DRAFT_300445 [Aspergillus undulatus]|uniref:uncharacterized protein n=1 Tax=Aspergillus undulatus TaxID=1810928 RepID=UPI003CCD30F3
MPSFLSLPSEILDSVCEYAALGYRPTLSNLALVSKRCYTITSKYRFQCISITVDEDRERLEEEIKIWTAILEAASAFTAVRHLSIIPASPEITGLYDSEEPDYTEPADDLTREDQYYNQAISFLFGHKPEYERDEDWECVARFLAQLSNLKDLLWAWDTLFPFSLLEVLHQKLPHCRLHDRAFELPSLHQHAGHPHDIDQRDYALATSPNLSSVLVPISGFDGDGRLEYNKEAVIQLARGLAPNLTRVHIVHRGFGASASDYETVHRGRPPWRGFFPNDPLKGSNTEVLGPVRLECWSLSPSIMPYFKPWGNCLDFSALRILHLWEVTAETLRSLSTHSFNCLKTLAIDLEYPEDRRVEEYSVEKASHLDEAASAFLFGLPPLESLHLSGFPTPEKTFQSILQHHGDSLHTLSLISPGNSLSALITVSQIKQIQETWPKIRDLRLPILRTQGNVREVAIYKALGGFTHLTDLLLQLHLVAHKPEPEAFDHTPAPPTIPSSEMLVNLAVDESLARAIFITVVTAGARSLQRLKVKRSKTSIPYDIDSIASIMMRQWECTSLPRNGNEDPEIKIGMREIGAKARLLHQREGVELGLCEEEFRKLWPAISEHWEDDWHSFPLESGPNSEIEG